VIISVYAGGFFYCGQQRHESLIQWRQWTGACCVEISFLNSQNCGSGSGFQAIFLDFAPPHGRLGSNKCGARKSWATQITVHAYDWWIHIYAKFGGCDNETRKSPRKKPTSTGVYMVKVKSCDISRQISKCGGLFLFRAAAARKFNRIEIHDRRLLCENIFSQLPKLWEWGRFRVTFAPPPGTFGSNKCGARTTWAPQMTVHACGWWMHICAMFYCCGCKTRKSPRKKPISMGVYMLKVLSRDISRHFS